MSAKGTAGRGARSMAGFSLLELTVALVLLALLSGVLFGSLSFAGRSWDGGEAKAAQVSEMRQTGEFLRGQLGAQFPLRARKIAETPLFFAGATDELRYAAALPSRVIEGGVYLFRLAVVRDGEKSRLIQERLVVDANGPLEADFRDAQRAVLAEDIDALKIGYYGRSPDAADTEAPTWRDRWDDPQRLPMLVRIDVVPKRGPPWPRLVVEPRHGPELGCRTWDEARSRCGGAT